MAIWQALATAYLSINFSILANNCCIQNSYVAKITTRHNISDCSSKNQNIIVSL